MNLITKEDLIRTNEAYWSMVNRARKIIVAENPEKDAIDVEEINVDPNEDYVFVSWEWYGDCCIRHKSTSYRINEFLSKINKLGETK